MEFPLIHFNVLINAFRDMINLLKIITHDFNVAKLNRLYWCKQYGIKRSFVKSLADLSHRSIHENLD